MTREKKLKTYLRHCSTVNSVDVLRAAKLFYYRQYLLYKVRTHVEDWVSQYLPTTPEPPPSEPSSPVYMSDDARRAVKRARAR